MEPIGTGYGAHLAREIRAQMARAEVSQTMLAEATGMARSTLNRKLSGDTEFTIGEVEAVARELGLPLSVLLHRAEEAAA